MAEMLENMWVRLLANVGVYDGRNVGGGGFRY